jgi:hypothetical protein
MRTTVKLTLVALTAAVLLASLVASASARSFSITNRSFRAVWAPLTFAEPFNFFTIRCNVTMEGSFHSNTIAKVVNSLIGYVTRAIAGRPCTGGEGWAWNGTEGALTGATSLPWHITYGGFTGTLPNITGININLIRPKFTIQNAVCLGTYQPNIQRGTINVAADRTTTITPGTETSSAVEGSCPAGRFTGPSQRVTLLGTTTAISVTLI